MPATVDQKATGSLGHWTNAGWGIDMLSLGSLGLFGRPVAHHSFVISALPLRFVIRASSERFSLQPVADSPTCEAAAERFDVRALPGRFKLEGL